MADDNKGSLRRSRLPLIGDRSGFRVISGDGK
jgi:hypothetical protein